MERKAATVAQVMHGGNAAREIAQKAAAGLTMAAAACAAGAVAAGVGALAPTRRSTRTGREDRPTPMPPVSGSGGAAGIPAVRPPPTRLGPAARRR